MGRQCEYCGFGNDQHSENCSRPFVNKELGRCNDCGMADGKHTPFCETYRKSIESTPDGLDQHAPGAKVDAGKNQLAMVLKGFDKAIWEMGLVGTFGATKYTPDGWKYVEGAKERYMNAAFRHIFQHSIGEDNDPDSNYHHLAHAAWNILAVLQFTLEDQQVEREIVGRCQEVADLHREIEAQHVNAKYNAYRTLRDDEIERMR